MLKKLLGPFLLTVPVAACAYPSISEIKNPPPILKAPPPIELEVVEKEWKCPSCNKNEQYVLKKIQEDPGSELSKQDPLLRQELG